MYEIKILKSEEFDDLPYEGISDSLGIADVKNGRVFVRHTGSHELNKYLINHEVDHMVEEHATDEDAHGIRHKKFFKDTFRSFVDPLNTGLAGGKRDNGLFGSGTNENNQANDQAVAAQQQAQTSQGADQQQLQSLLAQFSAGGQGSSASPSIPQGAAGGQISGSLNTGTLNGGSLQQQQQLSPDLIERIKGFYSGRNVSF